MGEEGEYMGFTDEAMMEVGKGGRGGAKKRRFSEEQIKYLESMFESQTKLEAKKKVQLARELGLQPRQVAIWFQNKRARWKSKQQEREYNSLRADYQALLSSFESLEREKQVLLKQLQKLVEMLDKPADQSSNDGDWKEDVKTTRENSDLKDLLKHQHQHQHQQEREDVNKYVEEEEELVCCTADRAVSSLASAAEQEDMFRDQQCCTTTSQWWDFWSVTE